MTASQLKFAQEAANPSDSGVHYKDLAALSKPYVDSFNALFSFGDSSLLDIAVADIPHKTIFDSEKNKLESNFLVFLIAVWMSKVTVGKPAIDASKATFAPTVFPAECRERGITYRAKMQAKLCWRVNDGPVQTDVRSLGSLPILVRSLKCHLNGKSPKDLVKFKEDPDEFGGYFIVNGIERLIRLLIIARRNHPLALVRPSFMKRGPTYSHFGVQIRSVRPDQSSQTITLHYCNDGAVNLRFSFRKQEYMVPIILVLRALVPKATDRDIFEQIACGESINDTFVTDRIELLLRQFKKYALYDQVQCLEYIGSKFAVMLDSPEDSTTYDAGLEFLKRVVLVHLDNPQDKFNMLIFMIRKLYTLVAGDCAPDNPDAPQHQEILLGGHLYGMILKEKFSDILQSIKVQVLSDLRRSPATNIRENSYISKTLGKVNLDVGKKMEYFLATGNLVSNTGLDLQQVAGFTVVAEKLNFLRFISHFQSVHRGAYFAELKTTTVRKLLPEAWGFLCPVHTPDGAPCGLLNHLSHTCQIINEFIDSSAVPKMVASLGLSPAIAPPPQVVKTKMDVDQEEADNSQLLATIVSVQLDGKVLGYCTAKKAEIIARTLRYMKIKHQHGIPLSLEIGYVPPTRGGQYPGLFLFSEPARMVRPVKHIVTGKLDLVGPFEQVYMNIACLKEDVVPGRTTHIEYTPTNILSVAANLTPFSDFNQSPRNMYQCQMGKQTMGTPAHNISHRTDNKMYRIQTAQSPIVRPELHSQYGMEGYPSGVNAVVAVLSYTGYDMEDASIINKSSHERGYGYGSVYKGEFIDLEDKKIKGQPITCHFGLFPAEMKTVTQKKIQDLLNFLDVDGLPHVGIRLRTGNPMYAYVDDTTGSVHVEKYKGSEDAYVDEVIVIGADSGLEPLQKVHIKLRIPRPPIIGDKFSSRHGQKGVCSQKYPSVDMPFSETGIIPDVIINPHAFPSRMTIGMFVESLAGKAGALHGKTHDATPFMFSEDRTAADYFGEQLKSTGFNYHGNEPMYSGITGEEFKADIYIGVVFYQRLRHMVSDKYQVRTTGPVHELTQQPVKGRKRAGGIRFGEMERDSLLAHGVSFLLQDRLMNCSDYTQSYVCKKCGSIITTMNVKKDGEDRVECKFCGREPVDIIAIPYVFRYLCAELAAMNVRLKLEVE